MSEMDVRTRLAELQETARAHPAPGVPVRGELLLEYVREVAGDTVRHLMHAHPVTSVKRKQGIGNVRRRTRLHLLPRLWHRKKVYAYFLELRKPLWLGEDGIIYREYADLFGNSYFMEARIWRRDDEGLHRIIAALHKLDPCNTSPNA